ncbi:8-oxo-dGTP diphosphatase [Cytobacillus eiseniae]|uniref:8-oxo-dGTP diphosphatase n=1 Tax=Cytobacillus eiseniae TaxID=762947 RepID=A0ABS4RJU6_9BACI|nr:NUDIX domain-containing protein [Cytobacillus eiseniae]MBP2243166.1 8-oxo-dGTP diphosphatase [Cytobacillus eiseniae]
MKIEFYYLDSMNETELEFAVISAIYKGKWVYVRHKERKTWEIAGGRREAGETIEETAKRELFEETGCIDVDLIPICDYSMNDSITKTFGRLYFARIKEIGLLPASEIDEIKRFDCLPNNLTYSEIQPKLFEKTLTFIRDMKIDTKNYRCFSKKIGNIFILKGPD